MNFQHPATTKIAGFLIAATLLALCSCSNTQDALIDEGSKKIINAKPLIEDRETPWATRPTAKIANQFLDALKAESPDLVEQIKLCAARSNPASWRCDNDENPDDQCLIRKGYWKGFVSTHLRTATTDLNGDAIPDYLVRVEDCIEFQHPYTWEVFVLLSRNGKPHHIALQTNVNRFDVMPIDKSGGKIIVDGISSYNGESASIRVLKEGRYVEDACFYRDQNEKLFRKTVCTTSPTQNTSGS